MLWIIGLLITDIFFQFVDSNSHIINPVEPVFISQPETYKFVSGETISLPCEVINSGNYVIAWKRGIAILTAGKIKVTPDPRMSIINDYTLQIKQAGTQDAGDYVCQIATIVPKEIAHTVEILVPPRIHHVTSGGHLQVKKGSPVRLECSASGNPSPNITWSRRNNILPNGEEKLHSTVLTIESMDRHKGGTYVCTANNGVGKPASSQVLLHVLYPPEITVERPIVYSGESQEAMLVCIVHGEAPPEVVWYKETMQLDTTERHIMEKRGSRHTLLIRNVHIQDFGNYTCLAENPLGKNKKTILLTGKPKTVVFQSPPVSQWGDKYNISWAVDSHTPVEEFKLYFRRLPRVQPGHENENNNVYHSVVYNEQLQPLQHQSQQHGRKGYHIKENEMSSSYGSYPYRNGYGNVVRWSRNEWRDVILPAIPLSHLYTQSMSYVIHGLEPSEQYEAKVQARNRYGWSDISERFIFSTSNTNAEIRDLRATQYNSSGHKIMDNIGYRINLILLSFIFYVMSSS